MKNLSGAGPTGSEGYFLLFFFFSAILVVVTLRVGNLAVDTLAVEIGAGQGTDHLAGIGLLHIEERIAGQKVDTAYVDCQLAGDELVEHVENIGLLKKPSRLPTFDVYALHAALGGAAVFLLVVFRTLMFLLASLAVLFSTA